MTTARSRICLYGVLVLSLATTIACGPGDPRAAASVAAEEAPDVVQLDAVPVVVATIDRGPMASWILASGNLEAVELVEVLAKVPGQVDSLLVEEGARLSRGDVMVELDPNEYRLAAARAEAEADKKRADLTRYERMLSEGVLSRVDFDQAKYDLRQAELAHEQARIDLGEASVRAPIDGVISARMVHRGARVSANQHLFTIVNPDRLWVHVHVPESDLPGLAQGQHAEVTTDVLPSTDFEAAVERIAPVVDPQSGTAKVTVRIESSEHLRPGMFVNVRITTGRRDDALLLPKRAIVYAGDATTVYRVDGEEPDLEATQVPVRLGSGNAEWVEVLSGAKPG